ncbi:MAG: PilZ domain-containing protein [Candidatus Electrothrix sp. AR4]|nr:PilZ domain-containing protein [Candidatus Electrothrix sp. AR4]
MVCTKKGECRRKSPRIEKQVKLSVSKLQYPMTNAEMKTALTGNVSQTGLCFTTDELYKNGTMLQLVIELQGWQHFIQNTSAIVDTSIAVKPLTAVAEVIWSKKISDEQRYTVGVLFKDIYEDDLQAFKKYLGRMLDKKN